MPGVALHMILADSILDRWRRGDPGQVPFDLDDPAARNAFHQGAVGPDLGYFPGGDRILSDLAHCVRTGALARTLLTSARTVRERAFALGWLTHVLADRAIHPIIGRGVGELLHGERARFVDGSSHPMAHLRVEMGLDAWYAARVPRVRDRRLTQVFDTRTVAFLVRAYAATYGVVLQPSIFLRSHRATTRRAGQALATMGIVVTLMKGRGGLMLPGVCAALKAAYGVDRFRSLGLAYLNPVAPSAWLLEEVACESARHAELFMDHVADGAACLGDVNLDTGRLLATEEGHPGTQRALAGLCALVGGAVGWDRDPGPLPIMSPALHGAGVTSAAAVGA